jgi:hypothetical protein
MSGMRKDDRQVPDMSEIRTGRQGLYLDRPQDFVHCFLFAVESCGTMKKPDKGTSELNFFLSRAGGLNLLLMLLNAHYNKRLAGRRPGWQFCVLHDRIPISRRALRLLIKDAIAEGLIEPLPGVRDKRTRTFCVTQRVVDAWERLTIRLSQSLQDVLTTFDPDALANADYYKWDPTIPASRQGRAAFTTRRPLL